MIAPIMEPWSFSIVWHWRRDGGPALSVAHMTSRGTQGQLHLLKGVKGIKERMRVNPLFIATLSKAKEYLLRRNIHEQAFHLLKKYWCNKGEHLLYSFAYFNGSEAFGSKPKLVIWFLCRRQRNLELFFQYGNRQIFNVPCTASILTIMSIGHENRRVNPNFGSFQLAKLLHSWVFSTPQWCRNCSNGSELSRNEIQKERFWRVSVKNTHTC